MAGELLDRQSLLQRVRKGSLRPEDADALAREIGGQGLSYRPSPDEYHTSSQPYWTLPMVLAWIAWRTYADVREWDARHLTTCRFWVSQNAAGFAGSDLGRRRPPNFAQFERWGHRRLGYWLVGRDGTPAVLMSVKPECARPGLWAALSSGGVAAFGIPAQGRRRVEIPKQEWIDLQVRVGSDGLDEFFDRHAPNAAAYLDVCFSRAGIEMHWPGHQRSAFPERADIELSGPPADPEAFQALYEHVNLAADILADLPADKNSGSDAKPPLRPKRLALAEANRAWEGRIADLAASGQHMTRKLAAEFAEEHGLPRRWWQAKISAEPQHSRLTTGKKNPPPK